MLEAIYSKHSAISTDEFDMDSSMYEKLEEYSDEMKEAKKDEGFRFAHVFEAREEGTYHYAYSIVL